MLKRERGATPRVQEWELTKVFPEARQVVVENIVRYQNESKDLREAVKRKHLLIQEVLDRWTRWVLEALVVEVEGKGILKAREHIARLRRLLADFDGVRQSSTRFCEQDIERARAVPIETVIGVELQKSGDKFVGLCPIHQEKTPSFYVYTKTNTFHCFGCGAGGDIINLVKKLYGCSFVEAVNKLKNI